MARIDNGVDVDMSFATCVEHLHDIWTFEDWNKLWDRLNNVKQVTSTMRKELLRFYTTDFTCDYSDSILKYSTYIDTMSAKDLEIAQLVSLLRVLDGHEFYQDIPDSELSPLSLSLLLEEIFITNSPLSKLQT